MISKRIKKIDWKKGSGVALYYIVLMMCIVFASMFFVELLSGYQSKIRAKIYTDMVADNAAYAGNTGFGINKNDVYTVSNALKVYNKDKIEDINVTNINLSKTDDSGNILKSIDKADLNTVNVKANLTAHTPLMNTIISDTTVSVTKILNNGGIDIVNEAFIHSYTYTSLNGTRQTPYIWGANRGNDNAWEQGTDCSGFVAGVLRKCGYYSGSAPSANSFIYMGQRIGEGYEALNKAKPGDIIVKYNNALGGHGHVGIYAGKKDGSHYWINCSGGSANTKNNPGKGPSGGVIVNKITNSSSRTIYVQRFANSSGESIMKYSQCQITSFTSAENTIAAVFKDAGFSNAQIAGILGNIASEGGVTEDAAIRPSGFYGTLKGQTKANLIQYAKDVSSGRISQLNFLQGNSVRLSNGKYLKMRAAGRDSGYGIAGFTHGVHRGTSYMSTKKRLYDYCRERNLNVGDVYSQAIFLANTLKDYSSLKSWGFYKNGNSAADCAIAFLAAYERPNKWNNFRAATGTRSLSQYWKQYSSGNSTAIHYYNTRAVKAEAYKKALDKFYPNN